MNVLLPCKSGNMIDGVWLPTSGKLEGLKFDRYKTGNTLMEDAKYMARRTFRVKDGQVRIAGDLNYRGTHLQILVLWVPEADRKLEGLRYVQLDAALKDRTFGPVVQAVVDAMQRFADH